MKTYADLHPGDFLHGYFVIAVDQNSERISSTLSKTKVTYLCKGRFKTIERWSTVDIHDFDTHFIRP